ncbi:EpsG family protein [Arcticibacter tournemirensis]|uniref:EpsG family protein n=1 Tax=Arcticibacter tournemirensis TaxID=699437 RepID=A0A4Q0M8D7_9SPHI|nr:EpsG family protein [Arcticibacter tournemirensis]RXF69418.1 EpsG family protein [Arcticibacter tournemirensis]
MWLFFVLIFYIIILSLHYCSNSRLDSKRFVIAYFSIITILIMFRSESVGNDTDQYIHLFNTIAEKKNIQEYLHESRFEVGFVYLNRILSSISSDPQILFIVSGFITAYSFARFIYQYSELPWLSSLMFMTLQFYDLTLTGARQALAIGILLFSYDFLLKRKFIPYFALVLLASAIHTSSILFLILYPLTSQKVGKNFFIYSTIVTLLVFVFFSTFLSLVMPVLPQYTNYFNEGGDSYSNSATVAIGLMLGLWLIMFVIARKAKKRQIPITDRSKCKRIFTQYPKAVENVFAVSVWLGIIMLFLALHGTILNRYKYVFSASMLAFYPNALNGIRGKKRSLLINVSCIVFVVYIIIIYVFRPEWQSTYPYSFFWNK